MGTQGDGDQNTGNATTSSDVVHYIGRFTNDHSFEWSGSGMAARFTGTGISVSISGAANTFEAFVDGAHVATFDSPVTSFAIANNLTAGGHRVEVYRRTEPLFGNATFGGFAVMDGELIASPFPFAHRMELIGDSITCGYGDLGLNGTCHLDLTTESELLAYGALTAQALDAAVHVIAWSGKGMWRQFGDGSTPSPLQMPDLYERTIPDDAASTWDHTAFVPEVIVINLGTNDWSTGDPGPPYEQVYLTFLTHLRSLYPDAHIFCTLGPMQDDPAALAHVQNVVNAFADARVHYLAFAEQQASDGYGCDYHPSQTTQQSMANVLEAAIREVTGW
jgi:hypothetical protein